MKTVLITGVGRGIGQALMKKFLEEGYYVIGTILSDRTLLFSPSRLLLLDLSSPTSRASCASAVAGLDRKIDILINNAGILADKEEMSVDIDKLRKTLDVNLIGTIDFTQRLLPILNEDAHIVNISSIAGSLERVGKASYLPGHYPAYKISKAALNMYTRTLALELADRRITVSSVHPGWVKTDIGGQEATLTSEQSAESIYQMAIAHLESGGFWFAGERLPW